MRSPLPRPILLLLLAGAALLTAPLVGCTKQPTDRSYQGTARFRYEQGMEAFEGGNYLEAVQQFTVVKNRFAYSQYAALSELRIADSYYEQAKYIESIDAYRTFVQRRPNHGEVPYALFRVAESYFQQRPSDFFLFPPPHEKDLGTTKDALRAYQAYLGRFPSDERVEKAREKVLDCRRTLADYELFVARFYLQQERPVSARGRLEVIFSDFEDVTDRWTDGTRLLIDVYRDLDEEPKARQVAIALIEKQPASAEADEARGLFPNL